MGGSSGFSNTLSGSLFNLMPRFIPLLFAFCTLVQFPLWAQSGTIVSWGSDNQGQVSNPPPGNDFVSIAGGGNHSLALKTDGSIVSWGSDSYGQVSNTLPGNDFVSITGGGYHSLALKTDGSIVSWGRDIFGQVSNTPRVMISFPLQVASITP